MGGGDTMALAILTQGNKLNIDLALLDGGAGKDSAVASGCTLGNITLQDIEQII